MSLLLHCGANVIERGELNSLELETPPCTETHYPIAHNWVLDSVVDHMERGGRTISSMELSVSHENNRFFGLMEIGNGHDDYSLMVGVRNSHDKTFPVGFACGSRVFVCDNLAFSSEVVISRKHTRFLHRDMDRLVSQAVGRLGYMKMTQDQRIAHYKGIEFTDKDAHDAIIRAIDAKVIGPTKIPAVLEQWREPAYPEFEPRTAWSLFNGFTEVLKPLNPHQLSGRTQSLHGLMDTFTGVILDAEFSDN
jgi:hypothetical protein